jgi:serine/threonine-protein kinase RsbW
VQQFSEPPEGAARRRIGPSPSGRGAACPELDVTVAATAWDARQLRVRCEHWLQQVGAPPDRVDDLKLVVYEALANAVEHAYGPEQPDAVVRLSARASGDQAVIQVSDEGRWHTTDQDGHRGRGLDLIRRLADDMQVEAGPRGTTVYIRAPLNSVTAC